jgi:hypothetical protein
MMPYLTMIAGAASLFYGAFWTGMAVRDFRSSLFRHAIYSASYAAGCHAFGMGAIVVASASLQGVAL